MRKDLFSRQRKFCRTRSWYPLLTALFMLLSAGIFAQAIETQTFTASSANANNYQFVLPGDLSTNSDMGILDNEIIQIGTGGTSASTYIPIYYLYDYSYSQSIYTAAELQAAGGEAGTIKQIAYLPSLSASTVKWQNWTIYMANTSKSEFASNLDWSPVAGSMQMVFNGDLQGSVNANQWMVISLDTPFEWDGTSNIIVAVVDITDDWGGSPGWKGYATGENRGIRVYRDNTPIDVDAPPTESTTNQLSTTLPQIQFLNLDECEGTPDGGTATADPLSGPSGATATFAVTGYTTGIGLSYDWEYSVNGGAWVSTGAGADSQGFTITGDHGDEFTVRYAVTCATSGETGYSTEAVYTIDNSNCTPSFSDTTDYIVDFQLEDIQNLDSGFSTGGYGDFTTMSTDLNADQTYTATLTSSSGSGNHAAAVWIDFNDDNVFDVSERVGTADGIIASATADITITIPADAISGAHKLRVVYQYGTALVGEDILPCVSATYGEGEDYMVNILGGSTGGGDCDWTVHVWDDDYYGDEVEWELRDSDGNTLLSGGPYDPFNDFYDDEQNVTASGPVTFWITNDGFYGDNEPTYEVSNGNGVVLSGQLMEGELEYESSALNCDDAPLVVCSGIPDGGTAMADPTSGPTGAISLFTVTGYSTGALGLTYDWEYSVNGGPWTSTGAGGDSVNFTITGNHGDEFAVRYVVTCTASGETAYSNEVIYTIDNTNCTPTFTSSSDYIVDFQLEDIQNMASGFSTGGYGDFTTMSTDLNADQTYTATLTSSSGGGNHAAAVWIDFDDNGLFDVSERVGTADGIIANATVDLPITIPAGVSGEHRLRVVYQYGTGLVGEDIEPCASASFGEGEDYMVNITGDTTTEPDYCTPEGVNSGRYIDNFSTTNGSDNISNMDSGFSTGGYGDFHETMGVTQIQGESIDFTVDIIGGIAGFRAWVDWNQDGIFDTTEEVAYQSTAYENTQTGSITVPSSATLGDTRMRIASHWLSTTGNVDPCAIGFNYGEFEDYRFTVEAMADCSGTPDGGTVTVDPSVGNTGSSYTVSAEGYTIANNMSYQWQSNTDGAGWIDEGTATQYYSDYTATAPDTVGVTVEWRLAVTCIGSGETGNSDTDSFTTEVIYCTPSFSNTSDYIVNFQLEDIQNMTSGFSTGGYGDFTAMSTDLSADQTYTASLTSSGGTGNHAAAVWIDFDDNGTFDVSERVGTADGIAASTTADLPITIPADAAPGEHRLRVVYQYGTGLVGEDIEPCASASFGEGEDYTVNITGGSEPGDGCEWTVSVYAGGLGDEVSWEFRGSDGTVLLSGGPYNDSPYSDTQTITADEPVEFYIESMGTWNDNTPSFTISNGSGVIVNNSIAGGTEATYSDLLCSTPPIPTPDNDDCGDITPTTLTNGTPVTFTGTTEGGTASTEEMDILGYGAVWEAVTLTGDCNNLTVDYCGTPAGNMNNTFVVYTNGCPVTDYVIGAYDFTTCGDGNATIRYMNLPAGTYYLPVIVDSSSNTLGEYTMNVVSVDCPPPPANDDCENAIALSCGDSDTGTTLSASDSGGNAAGDVFYSFTGDGTEQYVTVSLCGSSYDTYVRVFSDCTLSNEIAANDDSCGVQSEVGFQSDGTSTYIIMVEGFGTNVGDYTIDISCIDGPQPCLFDIGINVEPITHVLFAGIDNPSDPTVNGSPALEDFTSITGNVSAGESYDIALEGNTDGGFTNYFTVFIDWNQDGDLTGAGEMYEIGSINSSTGTDGQQAIGNIAVPADATEGATLMRVIKNFNTSPTDPCGTYNFGQAEDYTIVVGDVGPVDCGHSTPSNNFENGHGNLHLLVVANDFPVEENTMFTADQVKFNVILPAGMTVDAADVYFYEDTNGAGPGAQIGNTQEFIIPTEVNFLGNLSAYDVNEVVLDIDPTEFSGTSTGATYWLGIMIYTDATASYWEGTSILNTANEGYLYDDAEGTWGSISSTFDSDPFDGVFEITGQCEQLGISDMSSFDFAYYPNPVKDVLNITSSKAIENVSAYNLAGQSVLQGIKAVNGKVDMSSLSPGVYVFRVTLKGGQVETFKVIKK